MRLPRYQCQMCSTTEHPCLANVVDMLQLDTPSTHMTVASFIDEATATAVAARMDAAFWIAEDQRVPPSMPPSIFRRFRRRPAEVRIRKTDVDRSGQEQRSD